jgi:hypothetical protein
VLAPDTSSTTTAMGAGLLQSEALTSRSYINTQLRLELKL